MTTGVYNFKTIDKDNIRQAIEKYYKWSTIAIKNKEKLEKEISIIHINDAYFSIDGKEFFYAMPSKMIF